MARLSLSGPLSETGRIKVALPRPVYGGRFHENAAWEALDVALADDRWSRAVTKLRYYCNFNPR